jgi:hypothetical protein
VIESAGPGAESAAEMRTIDAVNASRNRPIAPALTAHYRPFRSVAPDDLARSVAAHGGKGDLTYWQTRDMPTLTGIDGPGLWITRGERDRGNRGQSSALPAAITHDTNSAAPCRRRTGWSR